MTKEEEILRAAEEEFFMNGYDACSTAVIAKRAGVTHAMVNYYFRTKEKLFIQILDNHVYELLSSLKPVMTANGNFVRVITDAALVIFDRLNADRRFPYLLSDISRTHPDFLLRYRDAFDTVCRDSMGMHARRLEQSIIEGAVSDCAMHDIYYLVLTLATAPFMTIPLLENVAGFTADMVDDYLRSRRVEMVRTIEARFSQPKIG